MKIEPTQLIDRLREVDALRNSFRYLRYRAHLGSIALGSFDLQRRTFPVERLDRLITVSMADVRGYTAPHHWRRPRRGFLVAGSWDIDERLDLDGYYRESRNYRSTLQIFADGRPYRESDQYRHLHHSLLNGGRHNRAGSIEELERYFQKLHEIFENIRTRGFLSQRELNLATPTVVDDVKMMVDRDGHLLRAHGGNHRFAMAQVLDLEAIPVFVTGIHARWAQRCYERFGGDLVSAVQRGLDDLTVGRNARSRAA